MAGIGVALGLLLPTLASWAVLVQPLPAANHLIECAGRVAMAVVIGIGVSSLSAFTWLLLGGRLDPGYAAADATLFTLIVVFGMARWLRNRQSRIEWPSIGRESFIPAGALGLVALVAFGSIIYLTMVHPDGEFDAWVIWNLRARFLFRAGFAWRDAFAPELGWASTEYPLLLPLAAARLWAYSGESTLGPAFIAGAFTLATPLVLAGFLTTSKGHWRGALAGLVLYGTPGFVSLGASQYADIPVATFILTAVALIATPQRGGEPPDDRSLLLAGLALGLAAWTKNEGLAAALLVVGVAMVSQGRHGIRRIARLIPLIAAGAALPAAAWITFHWDLMPRMTGSLFYSQGSMSLLDRVLDFNRWVVVGRGMTVNLPGWRLGFPVMTLGITALAGLRPPRLLRTDAAWVVVGLYMIFFGVFLATSWDLEWHLKLAADRTLLQIWPLVLFALFQATPDDSIDKS